MRKQIEYIEPTAPEDITVSQYKRYLTLVDGLKAEDGLSQFAYGKIVTIFCNLPDEIVGYMKFKEVKEIAGRVLAVLNQLDQLSTQKPKPIFRHLDIEFGFIPDFENISAAEYVDLSNSFNDLQNLDKMATVLWRPVVEKKGEKYEIAEYEGSSEWINAMGSFPVLPVLQSYFFLVGFCSTVIGSSQVSSLVREAIVETEREVSLKRTASTNAGAGTTVSSQ